MSDAAAKVGGDGLDASSSPKASFKIQKRKASDLDDDEGDDSSGPSKSNRSREEVELQAEREMQQYLKSKSVPTTRIKPIKVIVREANEKGPGPGMNSFSIKYKLPSGVEVDTKEAILPLVLPKKSPSGSGSASNAGGKSGSGMSLSGTGSSNKNALSATSIRKANHEAAKKKLQAASTALPVVVGGAGLKVLEFGKIPDDPTNFQNQLQLYPVGYKAEITIEDNEVNRAFVDYGKQQALSADATKLPATFNLIIKQSTNNTAIFVMENVDTKVSKRARTEKGVFREHFPGISIEQTWLGLPPFSFFNLQVELLIEGLPKALLCSTYRFHAERGYGDKYTDQKSLTEYKMRLLAQRDEGSGGEKGGKGNVSDALMERRRKRQEEKERAKANEKATKQLEAAQKAQQKLNLKEMKSRQREQLREAKKRKVLDEAASKKAKAQGLQAQAAFKYRTPYRQDARKQIFKAQKEVLTTIIERFDAESKLNDAQRRAEENFSKMDINGDALDEEKESASNVEILSLEQIFEEQIVSCGDGLKVPADAPIEDTLWDQMFRLSNFLTGQYNHLSLEHPVVVNQLVENFCNTQLMVQTADDDGDDSVAVEEKKEVDTDAAVFNVAAEEDKNMKDMIKYQPIAEMDRISLCLVQATMKEIHKSLDLDSIKLPLNQLTWPEVARMALLQFTLRQLMQVVPMHKDDIQNMIRGSKTPNFRQSKNVVRGIRYKMLARNGRQDHGESIEESNVYLGDSDRLLSINQGSSSSDSVSGSILNSKSKSIVTGDSLSTSLHKEFKMSKEISEAPANNFEDVDASALNEALTALSEKEGVPEVYKRCAKVLYKVVNCNQSKNFLWDSAFYRELLQFVKKPMVLSNVTTKLIEQGYGKGSDYNRVATEFYEDLKTCITSQLSFYSESHAFLAQGHKILTVIWRHVQQWILSKDRPALDLCSESYCLFSGNKVEEKETRIRCGRCNGFFCLNALHVAKESPFLIQPTQTLVDKQNFEEWMCMYCVQEDSAITKHIPRAPVVDIPNKAFWDNMDACYSSCFFIDEHGPSAMIPWQLNPALNRSLQGLSIRMSSMKSVCNALSLLSQSGLTPNLHCKADKAAWKSGSAAVWPTAQQLGNKWSIQSRLSVLMALAELLQNTDKVYEDCYEAEGKLCEKLLKHTSSSSFKETDFLRAITDLNGEEGYKLAKGVLKQINAERARSDYLSSEVRGVIEAIDSYKNKEEEEPILNRLIDVKAALDPKDNKNSPKELLKTLLKQENEKAEMKCQYCGYSEVDVGSPFVLGQSPAEHRYHVEKYGDSAVLVGPDDLIEGETETAVKFFTNGFELKPGAIELPYFPILSESEGKIFTNIFMRDLDPALELAPVIVHKHCALHMFKARLEHKSHELRRQRRRLAERMIAMSGVHTVPLGKDRMGREYWKFPKTNALFICSDTPQDAVQQDFCVRCDKSNINSLAPIKNENSDLHYRWTMTSDRAVVENITNALPASVMDADETMKNQVLNLQQNLKDLLENDTAFPLVKDGEDAQGSESQNAADVAMESRGDNETTMSIAEAAVDTGTDVDTSGETGATPSTGETATEEKAQNGESDENGENGENDAMAVEDGNGAAAEASTSEPTDAEQAVIDLSNEKEPAVPMERQKRVTSWLGAPSHTVSPTSGTALPEDQPVALTHLPHKGVSFEAVYEIEAESAFEEAAMFEYEDMPEEDSSYEQYFTFSQRTRRFIVLQLSNAHDRKIKLPAQSEVIAVNYKISREGQDLMITDIRQQWSDGLYYFYMPMWRRTGKYTLTFWTEALDGYTGPTLNLVKPLVFEMNVQARRRICGIPDAVAKLQASKFVHKSGRRSMIDKIRFLGDFRDKLATEVDMSFVEIDALKSCLFTMFVALPQGALMVEEEEHAYTGVTSGVAEAIGWNDSLEDAWFTALEKAKTPMEMMECVLLLEHYVNKNWFSSPQNQLMTALPAPHFAMRCITSSSVALRMFCIDKCLNYAKVESKSRSKRASGRGVEEQSSDRSRGRGKQTQYYDESESEEEDEDIYAGRRGSKRAAAGAAQARIRAIADDHLDESPRGGVRESARNRADEAAAEFAQRGPADSWSCAQCTFSNALRARNCGACGAKRSASLQQADSGDAVVNNDDGGDNGAMQQQDSEEMPVDGEDESPPPSGPMMMANRKKTAKKVVESDDEEEDYKANEEEEEDEEEAAADAAEEGEEAFQEDDGMDEED